MWRVWTRPYFGLLTKLTRSLIISLNWFAWRHKRPSFVNQTTNQTIPFYKTATINSDADYNIDLDEEQGTMDFGSDDFTKHNLWIFGGDDAEKEGLNWTQITEYNQDYGNETLNDPADDVIPFDAVRIAVLATFSLIFVVGVAGNTAVVQVWGTGYTVQQNVGWNI